MWVLGDRSILPQIFSLRDKFHARLSYCADGSKASEGRPAWWTKYEDSIPYTPQTISSSLATHQETARQLSLELEYWKKIAKAQIGESALAKSASLKDDAPSNAPTESKPKPEGRNLKPRGNIKVKPIVHETKNTFYRARFKVAPKEGITGEVWPQILRTVHNWLEDKEEWSYGKGFPSLYLDLTSDIEKYSRRFTSTVRDCSFSKKLATGQFDSVGGWTRLRTSRDVGLGSEDVPQYWALEYIEQDKNLYFRRWCTDIGITAQFDESKSPLGTYIVNIRVSTVDDPTYIGDVPPQPPRTVPKFINGMLNIEGCTTLSGGIELGQKPIELTCDNFDEFVNRLNSKDRLIPIVTVSNLFEPASGHVEQSPVDADKIATQLSGAALVYSIDSSDSALRERYWDVFGRDRLYEYRAWNGAMRVYFPKIDPLNPEDWRRHTFFSFSHLNECSTEKLGDDICSALSRQYRLVPGEATDIKTIESISERAKKEEALRKYQDLLSQHEELVEKARRAAELDVSAVHETEELRRTCEDLQEQISRLADDLNLRDEYIALLEQDASAEQDADKVAELELMLEAEMDENNKLREDLRGKQYALDVLNAANNASSESDRTAKERESILLGITSFPKTPLESLLMIEKMFPKELVLLPEAHKSAKDFGGSADETFNVLKCMAISLWATMFDGDGDFASIEEAFKNETTYELAMREGGQTNSNPDYVKLRQRNYKGKTINITPHVKGKAAKAKYKLRVYFWPDKEAKQIVIGHCGSHLPTSGTQYVR